MVPFFGHYNREAYEGTPMRTCWPMIFIVMTLGLSYWARESLGKTQFNRRVIGAVLFLLVAELIVGLAAKIVGIGPAETHILHTTVAMVSCGMLAILLDGRLWIAAFAYVAVVFAMAAWLEYRFLFTAGANAILTVTLVLAWRPEVRSSPRDPSAA
jgi:hypothetical protein